MGKRIIGLILVLVMAFGLVGCISSPAPTVPKSPTALPTAPSNPNSISDPDIEARLVDKTWISPAMVQIGNYYPGARAEWSMRIHNGGDTKATFLVSYRTPDSVKEGYDIAPLEAKDWVIIADSTPVLASKETKEVLVVLAMPKETTVSSQKWEFWVSVIEQGQGIIQTEMASRWLVVMR